MPKAVVDTLLIVAAVTLELRRDVVLVHNSAFDATLMENEQALEGAFTTTPNDVGSEPMFRRQDRSLTCRIGFCEWRTTFVDEEDVDG